MKAGQIKQFAITKPERLKSRKLIERLFAAKLSFAVYPFRLFYQFLQGTEVPLQAGFGVSAKNFRKAVDRNRVKRLMREAYRLQKSGLYNMLQQNMQGLAVFFIYTGKALPDYTLVAEKMDVILQRFIAIAHEHKTPR